MDPSENEFGHALRVTTRSYNYRLRSGDGHDVWRMHWHPEGLSPVTFAHLHLHPDFRRHLEGPATSLQLLRRGVPGDELGHMRAARFHGPGDIRLDGVPDPVVGAGQGEVTVDWCGICGTDLHEFLKGPIFIPPKGSPHPLTGVELPVVLGHEFAGVVSAAGSGVTGIREGDRVAVEPVAVLASAIDLVMSEVTVAPAYCGDHPDTIALLRDGRMDAEQFITGRIGLDSLVDGGFRELIDNKEENVKILVPPREVLA